MVNIERQGIIINEKIKETHPAWGPTMLIRSEIKIILKIGREKRRKMNITVEDIIFVKKLGQYSHHSAVHSCR
jgi:hypothetical protein